MGLLIELEISFFLTFKGVERAIVFCMAETGLNTSIFLRVTRLHVEKFS